MKTPAYHKSLETLHVNCLEPRAYFIPFADEKTAASRERSESDYFVPLCGEWDSASSKALKMSCASRPNMSARADLIKYPYRAAGRPIPTAATMSRFTATSNILSRPTRRLSRTRTPAGSMSENLRSMKSSLHAIYFELRGRGFLLLCLAQRKVRRLQRGVALHERI